MAKPLQGSYPPYFEKYIRLVSESTVLDALESQQNCINDFFSSIPKEKAEYRYAPGKWTLKELLQHIIDTERIFNYRALCIARKEPASLPGFEEDAYAANSHAALRKWETLCDELKSVRSATRFLFESFTEETFLTSGISNEKAVTVNALGFIIAGHVYHHKNIIEERYLV